VTILLCAALATAALVSLGVVASVPAAQRGRRRRMRPQLAADLVRGPEQRRRRR
jgi:hypothetical protein